VEYHRTRRLLANLITLICTVSLTRAALAQEWFDVTSPVGTIPASGDVETPLTRGGVRAGIDSGGTPQSMGSFETDAVILRWRYRPGMSASDAATDNTGSSGSVEWTFAGALESDGWSFALGGLRGPSFLHALRNPFITSPKSLVPADVTAVLPVWSDDSDRPAIYARAGDSRVSVGMYFAASRGAQVLRPELASLSAAVEFPGTGTLGYPWRLSMAGLFLSVDADDFPPRSISPDDLSVPLEQAALSQLAVELRLGSRMGFQGGAFLNERWQFRAGSHVLWYRLNPDFQGFPEDSGSAALVSCRLRAMAGLRGIRTCAGSHRFGSACSGMRSLISRGSRS
jgi:hypothetical protein